MKTSNIIISVLIIVINNFNHNNSTAQTTFVKTLKNPSNEYAYEIQQTDDGGYIIIGACSGKACLIKLNQDGDTLWTNKYLGNPYSVGYSGYVVSEDGYVVSGVMYNDSIITHTFLFKTDSMGDTVWTKTYKKPKGYMVFIQQTNDQGYVIVGNDGNEDKDIYVIKTDSIGNLTWEKSYNIEDGDYTSASIQQSNDNGYIIFGKSSYSLQNIILKTDENGNILWEQLYDGNLDGLVSNAIKTTDNCYVYITGTPGNLEGVGHNISLNKIDKDGNFLWSQHYNAGAHDFGTCVQQTNDNGFIITGGTCEASLEGTNNNYIIEETCDVYLIKTDENGDALWSGTFNISDDDHATSVKQTCDGGYIIIGNYKRIEKDKQISDIFLIKTDNFGNTIYNTNNNLYVYPNPCNGEFSILSKNNIQKIEVFNIQGKSIYTKKYPDSDLYFKKIDISRHCKGIYLIRISTNDNVITKKLVIN